MSKLEAVLVFAAETAKFCFGLAVTCVNAYVLHLVLTGSFPDTSKDLVIAIVNGTGIAQGVALQYYFGSSSGSAAKDRKNTP